MQPHLAGYVREACRRKQKSSCNIVNIRESQDLFPPLFPFTTCEKEDCIFFIWTRHVELWSMKGPLDWPSLPMKSFCQGGVQMSRSWSHPTLIITFKDILTRTNMHHDDSVWNITGLILFISHIYHQKALAAQRCHINEAHSEDFYFTISLKSSTGIFQHALFPSL